MKYILTSALVLIPIIIAIISRLLLFKKIRSNLNFTYEFNNNFNDYLESNGRNNNSYIFLVKNSNQMQNLLGNQGYMIMQQPFNRGVINHYAVIINGISQIRSYLSESILRDQAFQLAQYVSDSLIRVIGDNEKLDSETRTNIKNPFILYKIGWEFIISIPLHILKWFGILSNNIFLLLIHSFIFKILAGVITLIGFISSIMTLILGYEDFLIWIKNIFI